MLGCLEDYSPFEMVSFPGHIRSFARGVHPKKPPVKNCFLGAEYHRFFHAPWATRAGIPSSRSARRVCGRKFRNGSWCVRFPQGFDRRVFCGSLTLPKKEGKIKQAANVWCTWRIFNLTVHCLGCSKKWFDKLTKPKFFFERDSMLASCFWS